MKPVETIESFSTALLFYGAKPAYQKNPPFLRYSATGVSTSIILSPSRQLSNINTALGFQLVQKNITDQLKSAWDILAFQQFCKSG